MKLVLDTNILITYFWKSSTLHDLFAKDLLSCIAPVYALKEIKKYEREIMLKANITKQEFVQLRQELALHVAFVDATVYKGSYKLALKICPNRNDVDFFALAIEENISLWSNDKLLAKQKHVPVLDTAQIIERMKDLL